MKTKLFISRAAAFIARSAFILLALLLSPSFGGGWGEAAFAQTNLDINTDGPLVIAQDGTYTITGSGQTTNTITVSAGITADITLSGVSINLTTNPGGDSGYNLLEGNCPFIIGDNANVTLTLSGNNTLNGGYEAPGFGGYEAPGLLLAGSGATLIIDGSGSLTANGGKYGAGIGGNNGGTVIINGGNVTATSTYGAGIGGGFGGGKGGAGGSITISGGTVTASGGTYGAGIGGGYNTANSGTVTITGGSVQTTGKAGPTPTNGSGDNVYLNTLTVGSSANANRPVTNITYGDKTYSADNLTTDSNGKVYLYLPESNGAELVKLTANGREYGLSYTRAANTSYTQTLPLRCDLLLTNDSDNNADVTDNTNFVEWSGDALTIKQGGSYTLAMRAGVATTIRETVKVATGVTAHITLSRVNIDVNNTANACAFDIVTGATVSLTLTGNNTLKSGKYKAGLQAPDGAALVITETSSGSLTATGGDYGAGGSITISGGNGAGIDGGWGAGGSITISGGHVTATGGEVGGGGHINISDGTVTANGSSNGVGIGGGVNGAGGTIILSGGHVTASGGSYAAGIGDGASSTGEGKVVITGGSIQTTGNTSPQPTNGHADVYLNTLTVGSNANADMAVTAGAISGVACDETPDAATGVYGIHDVFTDSEGKVYFYLPETAGEELVQLTADNAAYGHIYTRPTGGSAVTLEALPQYAIAPDETGTYTFSPATYGYGVQAPLTVTVTNTGYDPTGDLTITVTPADFTVSTSPLASIAAYGSTATFTVQPHAGLAAGEHAATVTVSNTGHSLEETFEVTFTVAPAAVTFTVAPMAAHTYTGSAITPAPVVTYNAATLTSGSDYSVTYAGNINVGAATVTITGAGNYLGSSGNATFDIVPATVTFTVAPITAQTYTGSAIEPVPVVTYNAATLTSGSDYSITYAGNINVGAATVTITGAGNYLGSAGSATFDIVPKAQTITFDPATPLTVEEDSPYTLVATTECCV
jgi:hypothetical protein